MPSGDDLAEVPADLDQTFSGVRGAGQIDASGRRVGHQRALRVAARDEGLLQPFPNQDIDQIFANFSDAPDIKRRDEAAASRAQSDQAKLNLRYCKVYAESTALTSKSVNPATT
jgi:hypothetical protein